MTLFTNVTMGLLLALATTTATAVAQESHIIANGDHSLAFNVFPGKAPVIVLDAGGGNDSTYWADFAPDLAERTGLKVITYDRAGIGASDEVTGPWSLDAATEDLAAGLLELGATDNVILVSHSIAGEIATYLTIKHPSWFKGVVLVDANVPDFYTEEIVTGLNAEFEPMIAELRKAPTSASNRQLIAVAESFVEVSSAFHRAVWPVSVPVVVIGAEVTPFGDSPVGQVWQAAHRRFADGAPNRVYVFADNTEHETMVSDSPEIIQQAIADLVDGKL